MIPFTGVIAVYLAASQDPKTRMIAGYFGLAGEPFWFISAYTADQWGVILLVFVYGFTWIRLINENRRAMQ
jgi:hypothetical protein